MTSPQTEAAALTASERKSILSLAALYAFRMVGLFMVLPVLAIYAADFPDSTPQKIGLALGAYGLTQALLQIPFGMLSDRFGRKTIIYLGLALFALGSLVAAQAETLAGIIVGRALQGAGAIASTIMALLADLTRDEQRSKAMALIGMSIGLSFLLALVMGPWLSGLFGFASLFYATAIMAVVGMLVLLAWVPRPVARQHNEVSAVGSLFRRALSDSQLFRLYIGIFVLHSVLTALFVLIPARLVNVLALPPAEHGWVYVPVLLGSFFLMLPFMIAAERLGRVRQAFVSGIVIMLLSLLGLLWFGLYPVGLSLTLLLFFTGFNLMEAMLPSLVSRQVFAGGRGTAMGVYSTSQFLGVFAGGTAGGWYLANYGEAGVLGLCLVLLALWLLAAVSMVAPPRVQTLVLNYDSNRYSAEELLLAVQGLGGVNDVMVADGTATAYIKVSRDDFDKDLLSVFEPRS